MDIPPWGWRAAGNYQPPVDHPLQHSAMLYWTPCPQPGWVQHPGCYDIVPAMCAPPSNPVRTSCVPTGPVAGPSSTDAVPGTKLNGGLRRGIKYLYPAKHTYIQMPRPAVKLWDGHHDNFGFETFKVSCNTTTQQLIEMLGGNKDSTITECIEKGDGLWHKGISLKYSDKAAQEPITKRGWTEKRGQQLAPVWLVILPA